MIESPKKRFQKTPHSKRLFEITADPAVEAGLDVALLQMTWEAGAAKTPEAAAAMHWQLTGAYKLRDLFLTLSVIDKPPQKIRSDNLPNEI